MLSAMKKNGYVSVYSSEVDGQEQLIARKSCHQLEKLLKPISFKL
jgi:hypothetical protein